ncbi:hypothetical protein M407DRAFT_9563 [Tulasnella calospora MUT 4182]|uniref:Uncharacterized protein n=1 Tax=Tulasnella calospora MUT 4182 TaxID=1051891 RepID=A0A0C3KP52_9AGAM|nr:hypothetical protein M407DRAFT_9563 [Tulasnella calospora MUT 4182]
MPRKGYSLLLVLGYIEFDEISGGKCVKFRFVGVGSGIVKNATTRHEGHPTKVKIDDSHICRAEDESLAGGQASEIRFTAERAGERTGAVLEAKGELWSVFGVFYSTSHGVDPDLTRLPLPESGLGNFGVDCVMETCSFGRAHTLRMVLRRFPSAAQLAGASPWVDAERAKPDLNAFPSVDTGQTGWKIRCSTGSAQGSEPLFRRRMDINRGRFAPSAFPNPSNKKKCHQQAGERPRKCPRRLA